ncbi:MAG: right-handed parallel beta-helix repeat-containing protein [Verrucomicrobiales bacterium]|nr:right-handed parallel beta-helix repeat-containing protein [Verrucomicrobiales bacterium]
MPIPGTRFIVLFAVIAACGGELGSHAAEPNPDCATISTFADGRSPAREIFVQPSGNDSSGDGSRARPYRTLGRATTGVRPGDAIRLLPGTYGSGTVIQGLTGSSNAPIWIGGLEGEARPVFSGGSQALHLVRCRFLVLENLEAERCTQNGINVDDGGDYDNPNASRHLLFRNLVFRDIGSGGNQDCLKLSGVNDYFVLDCQFLRGSTGGSGIDHVGCHQGLIARCQFTDMGSNAIQCKGGSEDIEIRQCRFINGGQRAINLGGSTGFEFFRPPLSRTQPNSEARNIRVLANLFVGSDAPIAFVGAVHSIAAHNTLVEPGRWVMRILQETTSTGTTQFLPCSSNQFVNNLVWIQRARLSTFVNSGPNTLPATFRFANNLWYAYDRPTQSQPNLPSPETGGIAGRNPLFKDPTAGNYAIPTNSPAAGKALPPLPVAVDLTGACYADPASIGAFEANPPPPSNTRTDTDGDGLSDDWEDRYGFDAADPTDASQDPDGDLLNNHGEFLAGTHPRDATSTLRVRLTRMEAGSLVVAVSAVIGRIYRLEARDPFTQETWMALASISATGAVVEFPQPVLSPIGARWFRVRVE